MKRYEIVTDLRIHSWPRLHLEYLIHIITESGLQGQCSVLPQETPNTRQKLLVPWLA